MSGHLDALVRELADAVKGDVDEVQVRLRKAVVFAQSPLTVKIGGSDVAVPVQATGPIPANGTVCWVLESGPRRILLTASGIRSTGGDTITASAASVIPLVVKGAASQTANLLEARDAAGAERLSVTKDGTVYSPLAGASYLLHPTANPSNILKAPSATQRPLVVRGAASQTANLSEWQNDAGTRLVSIGSNGYLTGTRAGFVADIPNGAGLVVRGAASQTANLSEWQDSAGTVKASVGPTGTLGLNMGPNTGIALAVTTPGGAGNRGILAIAGAADNKVLEVRGAASQTANLLEVQNSAGTVLASVTAGGTIAATSSDAAVANGTAVYAKPSDAGHKGLVVRGAASQTANLLEVQNSAGTVLAGVDSVGRYLISNNNSDPLGGYAGRFPVNIGGVIRYVGYYA